MIFVSNKRDVTGYVSQNEHLFADKNNGIDGNGRSRRSAKEHKRGRRKHRSSFISSNVKIYVQ